MICLLSVLPEVSPDLVNTVVGHEERAPWLAVVAALAAIVVVLLSGLVWVARSVYPDWKAERLADRAEKEAYRQHQANMLAARGAESDKLATIVVDGAHKEIGERVADLGDKVEAVHSAVTDAHDTTREVQRQLASIAAKVGAPIVLMLAMWIGLRERPAAGYQDALAKAAATRPPKPGQMKKDCDRVTCRPPAYCSGSVCQNAARKPEPRKVASQPLAPQSWVVVESWQDHDPEPFPSRSDSQWAPL